MFQKWLTLASILLSIPVLAEKKTEPELDIVLASPWNNQVELGYQAHSGNSESESLNSRVRTEYKSGRHRSYGEWKFYRLDKNNKEDKRQSTFTLQSDYKLSTKTYLYTSFYGINSRYSAYSKDHTLSSGLGYQFLYTKDKVIELEMGPGFRYQKPNLEKLDGSVHNEPVNEPIFRSNLKVEWQVINNLRLESELNLITGQSNTSIDSNLSLSNNITDNIALKIRQSRQLHSRAPEGRSKVDSVFSVNLLFEF
ncbi:DUF481 domain-containing protein [Vibrio cholerae]|uniref:DUF481 domain-containing protein n=2 Tax=Vibrio cholerae TaxID=666 RepID=A0A5C9QN80_VIBCL|nr:MULTISPECIES: DUF481 domain-containing protein [Vibrio]KQA24995.1 membrane protein [Vibrio paracholerae 877-163]EGR2431336.1 DUF481 domain-containing protein [Vibrio cholerae]EGR4407357.1 DUF481 domain-containing protein [Vibrio cholerae]EGR5063944.1 DUF481 domain-containing protein [Vibrio cholerae]EJB8582171.1 DUF481 domain-containing protein [Vibrio cholerae]